MSVQAGNERRAISSELWDEDGAPVAVQTKGTTRGQARAYFAREWDIDFPKVKLRREWFFDCPDYRAEMAEDDVEEPYDGFPLTRCDADTPGAFEFWVLVEECR